ncbi:MAG: VWA domain-containing protein [Enhygromyxa sp.]
MPERIEPVAKSSLASAPLDTASQAPASDEHPVPQPRWRRPLLLVAGASLLTLGAVLNAERFEFGDGEERAAVADAPTDLGLANEDAAGGHGTRQKGEEGKMGKPSSQAKSGVYAMKGPKDAIPQLARDYEPSAAHFLASPQAGAFALGNDNGAVWGGLNGEAIGEAYGAGVLGLVGQGRGGGGLGVGGLGVGGHEGGSGLRQTGPRPSDPSTERYAPQLSSYFVATASDPKSTFSIDVDTASYANVRRFLLSQAQLPPVTAVRTEELINYFEYDYPQPSGDAPFSLTTELGPCPWNPEHQLVHVGVQGKVLDAGQTPPRNLVFLIDVSGSMSSADKLPLVKHGLAALSEQLGSQDLVSIVVYAGAAGVVLPPTSGADKRTILDALDRLESGGSTNGGEGIEAAYALAARNFIEGGVNRVVLASDGDFNVGISDHDQLIGLIEKQRETGVFLSVLGVGSGNLNDHMMEQLADKGNGNYSYIDGMFEARKVLVAEAGATLVTIAKDVKIQVEFDPDQVAAHRLVGYENRILAHHEFDDDRKDAGEIGAGHSVTAIYEIAPSGQADDDPLMQLHLRYKQPEGDTSRKISVALEGRARELAGSSDDYRFAAAVAAFAERLRGVDGLSYAQILELAQGSLGADARCYRHQFLELVFTAGELSGEALERPDSRCTPVEAERPSSASGPAVETWLRVGEQEADDGWQAFVLEVLRLLPPFLALPMFVMALRRPRRRR